MDLVRKSSAKHLNQTRIISRGQTHSLIDTPGRRPIQIRPQIDPQALVLAHVPRSNILALNSRRTPGQSVALICESAKSVFGSGERDGQIGGGRTRRLADVCVQFCAFGVD